MCATHVHHRVVMRREEAADKQVTLVMTNCSRGTFPPTTSVFTAGTHTHTHNTHILSQAGHECHRLVMIATLSPLTLVQISLDLLNDIIQWVPRENLVQHIAEGGRRGEDRWRVDGGRKKRGQMESGWREEGERTDGE